MRRFHPATFIAVAVLSTIFIVESGAVIKAAYSNTDGCRYEQQLGIELNDQNSRLFSLINNATRLLQVYTANKTVENHTQSYDFAVCSTALPGKGEFAASSIVERLNNTGNASKDFKTIARFDRNVTIHGFAGNITIDYHVDDSYVSAACRAYHPHIGYTIQTSLVTIARIVLACGVNASENQAVFLGADRRTDSDSALGKHIDFCTYQFRLDLNQTLAHEFKLICTKASESAAQHTNIVTTTPSVSSTSTAAKLAPKSDVSTGIQADAASHLPERQQQHSVLSAHHGVHEYVSHRGSRFGSFLLIVMLLVLVYFIGGIMYRRYVLYEQGRNQIPHIDTLSHLYGSMRSPLVACFYNVQDWSRGRTHSILDDGDVIVAEDLPSRLNVPPPHVTPVPQVGGRYGANSRSAVSANANNSDSRATSTAAASAAPSSLISAINEPTVRNARIQFVDDAVNSNSFFIAEEDDGTLNSNDVYKRRDVL